MGIQAFRDGYVTCLLWLARGRTEDGDGDEAEAMGLDELGYTLSDFDPESREEIRDDCRGFFDEASGLIAGRHEEAGHDFCLTRNGHGAGFWDGDWPEPAATELTKMSKPYGPQEAVADLDEEGDVIRLYVEG